MFSMSRPARARELKLRKFHPTIGNGLSRPARARELKPEDAGVVPDRHLSRPARARELKLSYADQLSTLKGRAPQGRVN